MSKIKVSIIIPCYNIEKYLHECLESIQNQTLKDIEIICIDDKSTDNTLCVLNRYSEHDTRIRVIAKDTNDGAGKTRNIGLDNAHGDYVVFMDPDDYYPEHNTLEKIYMAALTHKVDIAGGNLVRLTSHGEQIDRKFKTDGIRVYKDNPFSYGYTLFIYKRDFLVKNKICFPDYRRYQDPPFLAKAMILAKEYYAITDAVYVYRLGHKVITWTEGKILDVLSGISDIMALGHRHKIYKLCIEQINILWYEIYGVYEKTAMFDSVRRKLVDVLMGVDSLVLSTNLDGKLKYQKLYCDIIKKDARLYGKWKPYIKWPSWTEKIYKKEKFPNGRRHIRLFGIKIVSYLKKHRQQ